MEWRFATRGMVVASPTVWDDAVFIGSGDGSFHALDLRRGTPRWSVRLDGPVGSTAAVGHGRVHVVDRAGTLHTLDAGSGSPIWTLELGPPVPFPWGHESGDHYRSSPLLLGDTLIVAGVDGIVRSLDATTGQAHWTRDLGARIVSSPTADVSSSLLYVADVEGRVHTLDRDGTPRWTFGTLGSTLDSGSFGFDRSTIQSTPAVAGGRLFVGSRDGKLYALDAASGEELWRSDHGTSWVITSPAVADGVVYAGSSDDAFVQALDAVTGEELWRVEELGLIWASPTVAGDVVYVASWSGRLRALDRSDGRILWAFPADGMILSSPVVAGDRVIFGAADGGVYALRTGRTPVDRYVFHDPSLERATRLPGAAAIAAALERFGYRPVDTEALPGLLETLASDGPSPAASVVVFATNHLPTDVGGRDVPGLLRDYLEAGGKVVWPGGPGPLLWPLDPETGSPGHYGDVAWDRTTDLLDVDHDRAIFDFRGVRVTDEGTRWGLEGWWRQAWGVAPRGVTHVLGLDDWGLAASWVKEYGGGPGTGFVLIGSEMGFYAIYRAAEFRPGRGER